MQKLKNFVKKYFTNFAFFYRYIGNRIFLMIFLSIVVSVLDGFGLTMFLPLLKMISGNEIVDAEQLGNLSFIVDGVEAMGISITIVSVLLFMVGFFIFKGIASYLRILYSIIVQQKFIKSLRLKILNALNTMSFKNFITSDAGQIQNTMSGEVNIVARGFIAYFNTFQQGVMVLVYLGFAFFIDAQFAVLVSIGGFLSNFLYRIIYKRTKVASLKLTNINNLYSGLIIQHVGNFKYLRATGIVNKHSKKLQGSIQDIENVRREMGVLAGIGTSIREPLMIIVVAVVILIQVKIFGGTMAAIVISLLFFYRALTSLTVMQQSWNSFLATSGSLENMQGFQKHLESATEKSGKVVFNRFEKSIECQDISFTFGETAILKNINLQIEKNKSVAFVGESGSGKTTLVNVLTGLLEPNQGEVLIDGQNIQTLNKISYQQRIGYITQETVIFDDSIYNNVSLWADKTPENLKRFEKAIGQSALTEFIQELPEGKETQLGNSGINLSGGQKQRVSIARELFKEIDFLIMDEATSALDSETEKAIQESIDALQGKYTILIVAHRLSTIRNTDKIVFMDKGKIIAIDNFDGLVQKQERFKKMVELQEL